MTRAIRTGFRLESNIKRPQRISETLHNLKTKPRQKTSKRGSKQAPCVWPPRVSTSADLTSAMILCFLSMSSTCIAPRISGIRGTSSFFIRTPKDSQSIRSYSKGCVTLSCRKRSPSSLPRLFARHTTSFQIRCMTLICIPSASKSNLTV
jgi:hypothetical protein